MMLFKTWGYITMSQALQFTSDFKLGHYMKIPPRSMFWSQVIATVVAGTVQLGVQAWMFTNIPCVTSTDKLLDTDNIFRDMCSPTQKNGYVICSNPDVHAFTRTKYLQIHLPLN